MEVSKLPSKSSQNLNEVVLFFLFMSFFSILHAFLNEFDCFNIWKYDGVVMVVCLLHCLFLDGNS